MTRRQASSPEHLVDAFLFAKNYVRRNGFWEEVRWQTSCDITTLSEQGFLRESAWVVLSSGMAESVVRKCFVGVSSAYLMWRSAKDIFANQATCRERGLAVFGHTGKIDAISKIAQVVAEVGFDNVKKEIIDNGMQFIRSLPYMGPATSLHFAKNIGLNVAKPDRHLCRMADSAGYHSPQELCEMISQFVDDRVSTIDLILWRYATLDSNYRDLFTTPCKQIAVLKDHDEVSDQSDRAMRDC